MKNQVKKRHGCYHDHFKTLVTKLGIKT